MRRVWFYFNLTSGDKKLCCSFKYFTTIEKNTISQAKCYQIGLHCMMMSKTHGAPPSLSLVKNIQHCRPHVQPYNAQ